MLNTSVGLDELRKCGAMRALADLLVVSAKSWGHDQEQTSQDSQSDGAEGVRSNDGAIVYWLGKLLYPSALSGNVFSKKITVAMPPALARAITDRALGDQSTHAVHAPSAEVFLQNDR